MNLLLIEKAGTAISSTSENKYILEGVFTVFNIENRNGRIYTQKEFMPHVHLLEQSIVTGNLLGELDHPKTFDTSLKNASHKIEKIWYDDKNNCIKGRIVLLDTDAGRNAKALVDAGVQLQISSRAAGTVRENKQVQIQKLYTYDLVNVGGFAEAMLSSVHESYGITNENLAIYEMDSNSNLNNIKYNKNEDMNVTLEEFNKLKDEFQKLVNENKQLKNRISVIEDWTNEAAETITSIEDWTNEAAETITSIEQSSIYETKSPRNNDSNLASRISVIEEWIDEAAETITLIEEWSDEVSETVTAIESWSDEVSETVTAIESWSDEVSETVTAIETWSDEVSETVTAIESWSDEVSETVTAIESWSDEVSETVTYIETGSKENKVSKNKVTFESFKEEINSSLLETLSTSKPSQKLNESAPIINKPIWLEHIPAKYATLWESLSNADKDKISNRANIRQFKNMESIKEFWINVFDSKQNLIVESLDNNKPNLREGLIERYNRIFK